MSADQVSVSAQTVAGVFHGIQTLLQLFPENAWQKSGTQKENGKIPQVFIKDEPRFVYRGMHLDVGRHFFPVAFIKKFIDQLAYHKMNYFHWHLTEDQGWRIEIKKYPRLTEISAFRDETLVGHYNDQPHQFDGQRYGGFYTQEEVKEIVAYAQSRFITVIPEIELPGHSQAVLAAYPELACNEGPFKVMTKWGVSEEVYCPKEETFRFLEDVLREVIALFPSPYIHIGGDECPKIRWKESAFCQALIKKEGLKDEHGLQSYFIKKIEDFLNKNGKQIIGWDEILEGGLAPNATVMSWRGIEGGIEAARQGHDVIMTPTSHCYFDYYQSDHEEEPLAIGGFLPLKKVYSYEPVPEELNTVEAKHILGAQGNIWTEYMKRSDHVEYMAFPRLSALSEVVWSKKESRDYSDFINRLSTHLVRLKNQGINTANHLYDIRAQIHSADGKIKIDLEAEDANAKIYYTLDGSQPDKKASLYTGPVFLEQSTHLKAIAHNSGGEKGRLYEQKFTFHKAVGGNIKLSNAPAEKYSAGGPIAVINGIKGNNQRYGDAEWLGFEGKDFEAVIDLSKTKVLNSLEMRFF